MTKGAATTPAEAIALLRHFNSIDPKMQISTALTLLEIAQASEEERNISVQDLQNRIGLQSGTASRNAYYWSDGTRGITGAMRMVDIELNPDDRRLRTLKLNAKGRAFVTQVLGG